jgi:hypothetical protein
MRLPVSDPRLVVSYRFFAKDAYFSASKITVEAARTTLDLTGGNRPEEKRKKPRILLTPLS